MTMTRVIEEKCTGCGMCVPACTQKLFTIRDNKAVCDDENCFECGHCAAACAFDAIEYSWTKAEVAPKLDAPTFEEFERVLGARRSIRLYKSDPVPKELLEKLVMTANQAPTGSNRQGVKYIITSPETTKKLEAAAQRAIPHSNDYIRNAAPRKTEGISLGAPHMICLYGRPENGAHNGIIAATVMDLAANPLGLGICYNGIMLTLYNISEEMQNIIGLPEGDQMYMMMSVGYVGNEKYVARIIRPAVDMRHI